ncbi:MULTISPECIES: radical SAM protein [Arthrobacter]|uniref:Radical SAM protein n=1 Tax=Arthrobacter terricola TaxID=2547396 RepID=A0A4R5K9G1_9MICC|nr:MULTISPECIES: radical SAM protein [Arthrobacter]MBT8163000.1 hypothetical protein [Arthrobacter sp. GN70]TDF91793.1 radical SAM protein [Arthrobacter terricola]
MTAGLVESRTQIARLGQEWDVPEEDVLLIALNKAGVRSRIPKPRMRVRLRLTSRPEEEIFLILSLGRIDSPFQLEEHEITLYGERVATVEELEDDDAVLGYFRNGRKVLTLNSNARSQCIGCAFCPNTMEAASDPKLAVLDDLDAYLSALVSDFELEDLSGVETVTICTGCFHHEQLALDHLRMVRASMTNHNSQGKIHFLSSVLTSDEGLDAAADIGPFHLTTTIECFGRRGEILKQSKAKLRPIDVIPILRKAKDRGILADYTYIVGLDSQQLAEEYLSQYAPLTTTFPRFQIFQPHSAFMDVYVAPGAGQLEYYLSMRKMIERLFIDTALRPQSWENYRPLWYFSFADEPLHSVRL